MKKQMLKTLSMTVITLTIVLATAAVSTKAQSIRRIDAQIPFEFVVGDKTMAAGEYSVLSTTQDGSALTIRSANNSDSAIRLTNTMDSRRGDTRCRLVFHRYGQTYFLAEVWPSGGEGGRQLLKSKAERAVQRELARVGHTGYDRVELVAVAR